MESTRLDKELIDDPHLWVLALRLSETDIHVAAFSLVEDNSLIYRRLPLDRTAISTLKSIEDTIYDNPLLLCDFKHVYCIIDTPATLIVPASIIDRNHDIAATFNACHEPSGKVLIIDRLPEPNAAIVTGIDSATDRFLHRTFSNLTIMSHLAPLCRYFHSARGNTPKTYVNLRSGALDIIIIDGNRLLHANSYHFNDTADAIYYIIATRNRLGLSPQTDELLLCGDQSIRETITPTLRRYCAMVMPVIFPPRMFKAGRDAMDAPFDLIVSPICE